MPDRRRFAAGVPPLLALLAALLLNWSVAAAQAPDPLTLTITASRAECTAGTLNPVTWTITGGTPPYAVTVDGETAAADATSVNVTCGSLPEGAAEAPGTITAVVTDATGAPATASAAYTIVPPLPAPTGLSTGEVNSYQVGLHWNAVEGAGSQSPAVQNDRGRDEFDSYLLRYRDAEAEATARYEFVGLLQYPFADVRPGPLDALSMPTTTGDYLGMVAAIRHPIEQETPAALNWSAAIPFGVARAPENIVVQVTHDTLEVSWDEQPYTQGAAGVRLKGGGRSQWRGPSGITTADGRNHTQFHHLTPDTEYEITIAIGVDLGRVSSGTTARTSAAPADWEPLPRGPQNLRVTTTHDSIIVHWDPPFPEAPGRWFVDVSTIFNGTAWSVAQRTIRTPLPAEGVTLRGDHPWLIRPNTTYTVLVAHRGFDGAAAEVSVTTPAAPPALRLTLAAERAECTAGTLNPVTWEITGGAAPYRLTVDGALVDADAESATVTCGVLPEGARAAPGTITATVTDATGAPATASAAYTIVPPLPAPETPGATSVHPESLSFRWYTAERPPGGEALVAFLVRWREVGTAAWTYEAQPPYRRVGFAYGALAYFDGLRDSVAYEAAVAPMRHPLEAETPAALRWTPNRQATTVTYAANVTATSTHDTVTVRWDRQPSATYWYVGVSNADTLASTRILPTDAVAWGDPASGTHEVTLRHLSPDTEYRLRVATGRSNEGRTTRRVDVSVRTKPAPAGSTPLPRGPQNVRATSTATTITVTWDPPFAEAKQNYWVYIYAPGGDVYPGGFRLHRDALYAPPWTFTFGVPSAAQLPLAPGITYRIRVVHDGIVRVETEISIATQARAAPPLRLTLTASRAECTAATLNPVSWEIEGGGGPYRLTLDGASVDADAQSANATCGALPDYGIWLPVTEAPGTITATVTDATGAPATASAAYTIVPPLPAPRLRPGPATVEETLIIMSWRPVPGARPAGRVGHYLLRWRPADASTWRYVAVEDHEPPKPWIGGIIWGLDGGETYQHQSAAMRDPIEQETPQQLAWSATQTATTAHPPTGVVATATHDTLTVRWAPQTASDLVGVTLSPHSAGRDPVRYSWRHGDQPADQLTFIGLDPATTYTVTVSVQGDFPERLSTTIQAETVPAPPGWTPPPREPRNIRTSATHDSITVRWEHPYPGARPAYLLSVGHATSSSREVRLVRGQTEFTFSLLAPDTTYTVKIEHLYIHVSPVTIEVTTRAQPTPSASPGLTCIEYLVGAVICTWPADAPSLQ